MARPRLTETRQRRDYRFSSATLQQIKEEMAAGTYASETAFVEATISRYRELEAENARLRARIEDLERKLARASRPASHLQPAPVPLLTPVLAPSGYRMHTYQIYIKHDAGRCPTLPEGFAYMDMDKSIEPRQCPIHRVFAQPCAISFLRQRVEQLKAVPGIVNIWPDKGGQTLSKDCWRWERGRWIRDD